MKELLEFSVRCVLTKQQKLVDTSLRIVVNYLSSEVQCGQRVASSAISLLQYGQRRGAFLGGSAFLNLFMAFTTRNMQNAIRMKLMTI